MELNKKQNRSYSLTANVIYFVLFIASIWLLIWKCRYEFVNLDEPFYITIPYRLNQGDSLFANEWHLSQMTGFLLLPIVKLYMVVFKNTEGIILNFRYIFIFVQGVTSLLIFNKFKKFSCIGAIVASISFFLYAPYNINALSYNTLGIIFLVFTTMLLLTEKDGVKRNATFVLAGIFFAAAVLCCPYLIFAYALYTAAVFIITLCNKKKVENKNCDSLLNIKSWFVLSCGAGILAVVFCVFVLSRASIKSIVDSFSQIFKDPEHQELSFVKKILKYGYNIIFSGHKSEVLFILSFAGFVITFIDKKREKRSAVYISAFALLTLIMLVNMFSYNAYINFIMFVLNILSLECAIIFWNDEKIRKIFLVVWVTGIAYSICCNFTSNVGYYAISSATSVAFVGSVIIIFLSMQKVFESNNKWGKRVACVSLASLFVIQIGMEGYLRHEQLFLESNGVSVLTELIDDGPGKGIYTTAQQKREYYDMLEIKKQITEKYGNDKSILFLSSVTWYYLVFEDYRNSSYSAWLSGVNEITFERLKEYYRINPEKIPDLIFIDWTNVDYINDFKKEYTFNEEVFHNGSVLMTDFKKK